MEGTSPKGGGYLYISRFVNVLYTKMWLSARKDALWCFVD